MTRLTSLLTVAMLMAIAVIAEPVIAVTPPELPRVRVEMPDPSTGAGRTIAVTAGDDLQAAINRAQPGDTISLQAGATFRGNFTLPEKAGEGWITIRTSTPDGAFPAPGQRVSPSHAALMPKLVSAAGPVLVTAPRAHHYRLVGLELHPAAGRFLYNLIELGHRVATQADLPHHIVVDRSYLHGDPLKGTRRGIALNSAHTAVIGSYLSDFKEVGADSQAICGWNGPGPFLIENNYLEGAGENVMFGGADPTFPISCPRISRFAGIIWLSPCVESQWKRTMMAATGASRISSS